MRRRRFIVAVVTLSAAHLVIALTSLAVGFSIGIDRFGSGDAGLLERSANSLAEVLFLPGSYVYRWAPRLSGLAEWTMILGNSLLWGVVAASIMAVFVATRRRVMARRNRRSTTR